MTQNKLKRYERKWIFNSTNVLFIINALLRSKFLFNFQYEKRKVNSIYFDDRNYSSIRENLDGVSEKKKYRIRWYGKKNIVTDPNFEIKSKKGFETKKTFLKIKELNNLSIIGYDNLEKIKNLINNKFKFRKIILPLLTTHYDREYFISNNGLVRATVDYNLQSKSLNYNKDTNILKNYYSNITLEIKYNTNLDKYVRDNLKSISNRLSRNSKFVNSAVSEPFCYS